ncbi:SIMPL domain-containing protein [Glaciecola siphonariae]|uniref:SIMPL domain-containing protein n=1 Tax=Glaciecola siphonariae TaxID=521012 RepID=A0ABV9LZ86_9ALTE
MNNGKSQALILGILLCVGLIGMGVVLGNAAIDYKKLDRTVSVKGLSEREFEADVVIWPIQYAVASNAVNELYEEIEQTNLQISNFLTSNNIQSSEITFSMPAIIDRSAQQYSYDDAAKFRYTASQNVTVYSNDIATVRAAMAKIADIGKQGIVLTGDDYAAQTEYLFTKLNDAKPSMIEEATKEARMVAEKFAADSNSQLGKIMTATQGQFSISERDKNNPHIKKVRVVSTVKYYLTD